MMSKRLCHEPLQAEQEPVVGLGPLPVVHLVTVSIRQVTPPRKSAEEAESLAVPLFLGIQENLKNLKKRLDIHSPTCCGVNLLVLAMGTLRLAMVAPSCE